MVFQSYALYPHMTVYDNMAFSLKLHKVPRDEIDRAVREAARILDLETLLERKPKALSGGQRQRVAMGRAIVRNPKVFLMDEPLSNLDAKLRGQMRVEISKLHQRLGATIIYVTHDQTEAMTLGTRIVVMKDGIVQQVDNPQNLYNHPSNKFVAGFIGSPQMNMISARVAEAGGEILLEFEDNRFALEGVRAKALRDGGYVGKTVTLGIRPEHIYDARTTENRPGLLHFQTQVRVYEMLGANALVYFDMGQAGWVASVDATVQKKSGDVISLALDTAKVHVFDSESEMAIEG